MKIPEMIEVLQAAERGEKIEYECCDQGDWEPWKKSYQFNFDDFNYRIAPKKKMTLVEELRMYYDQHKAAIYKDAADRIEELEKKKYFYITDFTINEMLDEIKGRIE